MPEDAPRRVQSVADASFALLQTLADAWAERAMDPWTQKALRPAGDDAGGRLMEAAMEPMLHAHSAQGFDLEKLLPLAVAVLQINAGSRGHKSAEEVRFYVVLCESERERAVARGSKQT